MWYNEYIFKHIYGEQHLNNCQWPRVSSCLFESDVVNTRDPLTTSKNRVQESRGRSHKLIFLWPSAQQRQQVGAYTKMDDQSAPQIFREGV